MMSSSSWPTRTGRFKEINNGDNAMIASIQHMVKSLYEKL